jgi:hypothetical protein
VAVSEWRSCSTLVALKLGSAGRETSMTHQPHVPKGKVPRSLVLLGRLGRRREGQLRVRIRRFGPGTCLPQLWDGVLPMYRARSAARLETYRHLPYIVLRLATLAPGALRENNEQ